MEINTGSFRKSFRQKYHTSNLKGFLHMLGVLIVALSGIIYPLSKIHDLHYSELWVVLATFLYANVVEYLMHRFPMHHRYKRFEIIFDRHTMEHHQFFTERDSSMEYPNIPLIPSFLGRSPVRNN